MTPKELANWYLNKAIPLIEKNRSVIAAVQIWNEPFNFPRVDKNGKRAGAWPTRYGGRWFGGAYVDPFADFTFRVAAGLRNLGYPVSIVEDAGLYKVRAGEYRDRPAADEAVRAIRSRIGGVPFVVVEE